MTGPSPGPAPGTAQRDAIRKAITDAYYEARNAGQTMETAADNATDAVLAALAAPSGPQAAAGEGCDSPIPASAGIPLETRRAIPVAAKWPETVERPTKPREEGARHPLRGVFSTASAATAPPAGVPADRARDEDDGIRWPEGRNARAYDVLQETADALGCPRDVYPPEHAHAVVAERDALAAAVERVRALPDKWIHDVLGYPDTSEGQHASTAVEFCGREVVTALDGDGQR